MCGYDRNRSVSIEYRYIARGASLTRALTGGGAGGRGSTSVGRLYNRTMFWINHFIGKKVFKIFL